jgi:hypothetical protein
MRVPRGFTPTRKVGSAQSWPVPLHVLASFPIRRGAANAACPRPVLESMPPDGIYMLVAEYTKPPPPGFPAGTPIGARGDLAHLDLRPAEVECWDAGLSGTARFRDHGRDFYVEVLLGPKVTASQRRRALQALASLTVSPS